MINMIFVSKKYMKTILFIVVILTCIITTSCTDIQQSTETTGCYETETDIDCSTQSEDLSIASTEAEPLTLDDIPPFAGMPYVVLDNNIPHFTENDYLSASFEIYSDMDSLGRCGLAFANVGPDTIPTEERGVIGHIKPSGWHTVKYDCVDGKYLYNRCHLIAYNLCGENSNEKNLITGTRYMNVQGMLPFEIKVYDYVVATGNHVLYRVTPIFEDDNLLAAGVVMEGWSVEDSGKGICFNVFVYNAQPGVEIDYVTGESRLIENVTTEIITEDNTANDEITSSEADNSASDEQEYESAVIQNADYILNTNSYKFHYPTCEAVAEMSERNRKEYIGDRAELINQGFVPCRVCNP